MPVQAPQAQLSPNDGHSPLEGEGDTRQRLLRTHNKLSISRTHFGFGGPSSAAVAKSTIGASSQKTDSPTDTDEDIRSGKFVRAKTQRTTRSQQAEKPLESEEQSRPKPAQYGASSTDERIRRRRASLSSQASPTEEKTRPFVSSQTAPPNGVSRAKSARAPPSSWASHQNESTRPTSSGGSAVGAPTSSRNMPERPGSARSMVSNPAGGRTPSRQGSVSRKSTAAATNTPQTTKPVTRSSSVQGRSTHTRSASASMTPASRPPSTASVRRDVPAADMKPPPRPAFSTHQQRYSPTKRSTSATTTPSKASAVAGSAASSPSVQASNALSIDDIRQQTNLLQLSLLHATAGPTFKAWTSSAYRALSTRFNALRQRYDDVVALERQARQHRNLLAMHRWSAGNTRALSRKLAILQGVLEELCSLIHPGDAKPRSDRYQPLPSSNTGRYTYVLAQFSTWAAWVKSVWSQRDLEASLSMAPSSSSGPSHYRDESGDNMLTPPSSRDTNSAPIWSPKGMQRYTPIDGLGDATKSELRSLKRLLDTLAVKLEDAATPSIPGVMEPAVNGVNDWSTASPVKTSSNSSMVEVESSVSIALRLTQKLLHGMQEELQLLREVEFEVVAGEKAWVDEMLKDLDNN